MKPSVLSPSFAYGIKNFEKVGQNMAIVLRRAVQSHTAIDACGEAVKEFLQLSLYLFHMIFTRAVPQPHCKIQDKKVIQLV